MQFEFHQVPLALELVRRAGGNPDQLLARSGMPADAGTAPFVSVHIDVVEGFLVEAGRDAKVAAFGLELANSIPRGRFGWLEFCLRSSRTLDDAWHLLARYGGMINRKFGFAYAVGAHARTLTCVVPGRPAGVGAHFNEFVIACLLRMSREALGQAWRPERVWFAHAEPPWVRDVLKYFGCPVTFRAKSSGLAIPAAAAMQPLEQHDQPLHELLRARVEELMPMATSSQPMAGRTRSELVARIGREDVSAATIARALGVSTRTLQRTLGEEGTTFAALVEDARRSLAETLLARKDLAIEQVAALLGYADLRGFDRAFKRWTGTSPTRWRARSDQQR